MSGIHTRGVRLADRRAGAARHPAHQRSKRRPLVPLWRLAPMLLGAVTGAGSAYADSLTQRDVQIMAKAIGFLDPSPAGPAMVAVVYDPAIPGSKQDADAISGYFGSGLKAGAAMLTPKTMEVGGLAAGGFIAVIVAAGVKPDRVLSVTSAQHVACVTGDATAIQSGQCVMSVKSDPKVEILISHSAATASRIGFGSAFLMMAHEI